MALWGGRFQGDSDPLFKRFNDSLRFDYRLLSQDVQGSIAWARAIERAGVLTERERQRLVTALRAIEKKWGKDPALIVASGEEDVHSFVESQLIAALGPLGKKLHTGRSRNDQVATDLRLWVRGEIDERLKEIRRAQDSLLSFARRESKTVTAGYTHLQRAQPVLIAHAALAYFEMLDRDADRLASARLRVNVCPLGSGALAGSAYRIDRKALAKELGFAAPTANSLDAVSSRDFVLETLAALSICAGTISRFAEDLILLATAEFGVLELSDAVSSGSSLMPQKKNPDALELMRGKSGRVFGAFASLALTTKGLPLAYNKDLQEDKEPLFDAMESVSMCLRMFPPVLDGAKIRRERCLDAAKGGYSNATELADYLVARGVPFREAHDTVGRIVRRAIERGLPLEELPLEDFRSFDRRIDQDVYAALGIEALLSKRELLGGTGRKAVAAALRDAQRRHKRASAMISPSH